MSNDHEAQRSIQLSISGLPDNQAVDLGEAFRLAIFEFGNTLDLRRLTQIIITGDFAGTIAELSERLGSAISYTQEEYGTAGAKLISLPSGEDFEMVLVFTAQIVEDLILKEETPEAQEKVLTAIHSLHHELCHVHDSNKRADVVPVLATKGIALAGKAVVLFPLAEACWSEYFANYLSSGTATTDAISTQSLLFRDALTRAKAAVDQEILAYRLHADIHRLMGMVRRHGEWLPKMAAYLIGFVHGTNNSLASLSPESAETLSGSYFEETWNELAAALAQMREGYVSEWTEDLTVYDGLYAAIERYYATLGMILSTAENGHCHIDIPLRPETTPAN
ncbi:MAG: hypothetical protein QOF72_1582 [Blastocatellia bacterium]|nr:hypothetical protein [Blastocatellia bacterium]